MSKKNGVKMKKVLFLILIMVAFTKVHTRVSLSQINQLCSCTESQTCLDQCLINFVTNESGSTNAPQIVNSLLNAGANVNATDANGNTPLIYAIYDIYSSNYELNAATAIIINYLINAGADINQKNANGDTPSQYGQILSGIPQLITNLSTIKNLIDQYNNCATNPSVGWSTKPNYVLNPNTYSDVSNLNNNLQSEINDLQSDVNNCNTYLNNIETNIYHQYGPGVGF